VIVNFAELPIRRISPNENAVYAIVVCTTIGALVWCYWIYFTARKKTDHHPLYRLAQVFLSLLISFSVTVILSLLIVKVFES
jgi:Na+/proline symporter